MRKLNRQSSQTSRAILVLPLAAATAMAFAHDNPESPNVVGTAVLNCKDNGPSSLRGILANAVDNQTIDLSRLTCGTITLTTGALIDSKKAANVTLLGPGADKLTIDASQLGRALVHNGAGKLTIQGLTITHGTYSGARGGGCIYSRGSVQLENSTVSSCVLAPTGSAPANGGGIYALDSVDLEKSTVTGNTLQCSGGSSGTGTASGGGIWSGGALTVDYSTVSNNRVSCHSSPHRGGGFFSGAAAKIYSSTIAGNTAPDGGAAYFAGDAIVQASTISGNRSSGIIASGIVATHQLFLGDCTITENDSGEQTAPAVFLSAATTARIYGTIIYGNPAFEDIFTDDIEGASGAVVIGSNNLIRDSRLTLPSGTLSSDPFLGPLSDNGGAAHTLTHALTKGSPAIDHGINTAQTIDLPFDQRGPGFSRVAGGSADIGAFEFLGDRIFANGFN